MWYISVSLEEVLNEEFLSVYTICLTINILCTIIHYIYFLWYFDFGKGFLAILVMSYSILIVGLFYFCNFVF